MDPILTSRVLKAAVWAVVVCALLFVIPVAFCTVVQPGCVSCHARADLVSTVSQPAHAEEAIECVSCHVGRSFVDRVGFGYYQAFGMVVPFLDTADTVAAQVRDASCTSCHGDLAGVTVSSGLRIDHGQCAVGSTCVDCHSTVAHGDAVSWPTTYHMDYCLRCHDSAQVSSSCDTCHVGKLDKTRPSTGPWAVTHGPDWERTHGMGDMATCSACHAEDYCARCHGAGVPHTERFFMAHGRYALEQSASCSSCHRDETFCSDCHGMEMPHTTSFTRDHSDIVDADGDSACLKCHLEEDCTTCHVKHVHPGGAVSLDDGSGGSR